MFCLLIENIDVVITANNTGLEIADVFVSHNFSHLVIWKLIEMHTEFFFENHSKLHDFGWMETAFWFDSEGSCV